MYNICKFYRSTPVTRYYDVRELPMHKSFKYIPYIFLIGTLLLPQTYAYNISAMTNFPSTFIDTGLDDNYAENTIKTLRSKQERIKNANQLINQLNAFDEFLPDLSESDVLEIQKQRKYAIEEKDFGERANKLTIFFNNPNLALLGLKGLIKDTVNALNCVVKSSDISVEMFCWAKASALLSSNIWDNDIKSLISHEKILDIKSNLPISDFRRIYNNQADGILNFIILPYLSSQIPNKTQR